MRLAGEQGCEQGTLADGPGQAHLADSVEKHMEKGLPLVGAGSPVSAARKELEESDAILVVEDGKPVGVLTRADLLGFLAD